MFPIGDQNEPGRGAAVVTLALIVINVLVFVFLQQTGAETDFTYGWSAIPREITRGVDLVTAQQIRIGGEIFIVPEAPGPDPIQVTLLSSMFMHAGWLHLGGNMLFLWVFGDNVEHRAGPLLYLLIYLVAGIVGTMAQILSDPNSVIPTLGASGAISGVLGAYLVLFPRNRVLIWIVRFPVYVPAIVAIGLWIAFQLVASLGAGVVSDESTGGVAYLAHFGGFATGLVAGLLLRALPPRRAARAW